MATTAEYLAQLQADKQTLVDNLVAKGVEATNDETFTTLAPKVADIQSGGGEDFIINDARYLCYENARGDLADKLVLLISPECTNFSRAFYNCTGLTKATQINTSYANDLSYAFKGCSNLTDVAQIDASNATTIAGLFNDCKLIKSAVIKNVTNKIKNLETVFSGCQSVTELNCDNWDTSNVTNINSCFRGCYNLKTLSCKGWDTSNVTQLSYIFYGTADLEELDLSGWDAGKVTYIADFMPSAQLYGRTVLLTDLLFVTNLGKAFTQKTTNYLRYKVDLSNCKLLNHDSLMDVINKLYDLNLTYDVANGGTLYAQSLVIATECQSLLSDEEIATATNKGWNVSFA